MHESGVLTKDDLTPMRGFAAAIMSEACREASGE
jgi:hypothetical protein